MKNFKERTISLASYMLARFLEGKDLNNNDLFTHYLEELYLIMSSDMERCVEEWEMFVHSFAIEVIEGEYTAIIEHSKNNRLNELFNELYGTDVFNSDDEEIQVLQNKVLELLV